LLVTGLTRVSMDAVLPFDDFGDWATLKEPRQDSKLQSGQLTTSVIGRRRGSTGRIFLRAYGPAGRFTSPARARNHFPAAPSNRPSGVAFPPARPGGNGSPSVRRALPWPAASARSVAAPAARR